MDRLTRERLDGIEKKLSYIIALLHGLVLEAAVNDEDVVMYRLKEDGNLESIKTKTGNGKG